PQHEELVLELLGLQRGGAATIDAGLALGVETVPAEPAPQVLRVDAGEPTACVDIEDPLFHVERVVVLLGAFVGVERLPVADGPLAIALAPGGRPPAARTGAGAAAAGGGRSGLSLDRCPGIRRAGIWRLEIRCLDSRCLGIRGVAIRGGGPRTGGDRHLPSFTGSGGARPPGTRREPSTTVSRSEPADRRARGTGKRAGFSRLDRSRCARARNPRAAGW